MNAAIAMRHPAPRASSPERYPGKSQEEKARLIRAEVQLISRFHRSDCQSVAWRCHVCNGRVDISGVTVNSGRALTTTTKGKCRTPDCLDWED